METTVVITVNKIVEEKTAKIVVDLKSITGGYSEKDNDTNTNTTTVTDIAKTASVTIKVDGKIRSQDSGVDKNKTVELEVTGTTTASIEVEITDSKNGKWIKTHTLDFSKETEYTFK